MVDPDEVGLEVVQQFHEGAVAGVDVLVDDEGHVCGFLGCVGGGVYGWGVEDVCPVVREGYASAGWLGVALPSRLSRMPGGLTLVELLR
jgi:hypothetical protein